MSLIAGIDYSTHAVDVVWLDEDTDRAEWRRYDLYGHDAFERTRSVPTYRNQLRYLHEQGVIAIGIEEPRGYNAGALYRVQGAILACLPRSVLVQPWLPGEWRRRVGMRGNATKQQVEAFARARLAAGGWSEFRQPVAPDFFDAYCIALATRNALQKEDAAWLTTS